MDNQKENILESIRVKFPTNISLDQIEFWIEKYPYAQFLHLLKAQILQVKGGDNTIGLQKIAAIMNDKFVLEWRLNNNDNVMSENNKESVIPQMQNKPQKFDPEWSKFSIEENKSDLRQKIVKEEIFETRNSDKAERDIFDPEFIIMEKMARERVQNESILPSKSRKPKKDENVPQTTLKKKGSVMGSVKNRIINDPELKMDKAPDTKENKPTNKRESSKKKQKNSHTQEKSTKYKNSNSKRKTKQTTPQKNLIEENKNTVKVGQTKETNNGLTNFTKWLISIDKKGNNTINQSRVDQSITENEEVVSEHLVELLAGQGKTQKAKAMIDKLILLYPEKSDYFATRFEKLQLK